MSKRPAGNTTPLLGYARLPGWYSLPLYSRRLGSQRNYLITLGHFTIFRIWVCNSLAVPQREVRRKCVCEARALMRKRGDCADDALLDKPGSSAQHQRAALRLAQRPQTNMIAQAAEARAAALPGLPPAAPAAQLPLPGQHITNLGCFHVLFSVMECMHSVRGCAEMQSGGTCRSTHCLAARPAEERLCSQQRAFTSNQRAHWAGDHCPNYSILTF